MQGEFLILGLREPLRIDDPELAELGRELGQLAPVASCLR